MIFKRTPLISDDGPRRFTWLSKNRPPNLGFGLMHRCQSDPTFYLFWHQRSRYADEFVTMLVSNDQKFLVSENQKRDDAARQVEVRMR
jgi:hypothetical protein